MRDIHSFMARRSVVTGRRVILGLCLVASLSCRADIRLPKSFVDAEQDGSGLVWTLVFLRWQPVAPGSNPFLPDVKPSPLELCLMAYGSVAARWPGART